MSLLRKCLRARICSVLFLAVLLNACGGDNGNGNNSFGNGNNSFDDGNNGNRSASAEQVCIDIGMTSCDFLESCFPEANRHEQCATNLRNACAQLVGLEHCPEGTFHQDKLDNCIASLNSRSCDILAPNPVQPVDCQDICSF